MTLAQKPIWNSFYLGKKKEETITDEYFFKPEKPGSYGLGVAANLMVEENHAPPAEGKVEIFTANISGQVGSLIKYPGEGYLLPANREVIFYVNPEFVTTDVPMPFSPKPRLILRKV